MDIDSFYDEEHNASQNKLIEGREYISYPEFKRLLQKYTDEQLFLPIVTKRNWFEKMPLHWRLLYYFIGGIIIGLLLPYVW